MEHEPGLRAGRIAAVYRQVPGGIAATVANATLMTVVLVGAEHDRRAFIWLGAVLVVAALRLVLWSAYCRRSASPDRSERWGAISACAAGAAGLLWGGGATWLWPQSEPYRLFWVFAVGGMCTGAVTVYHAHLATALAFILSAGVPVATRLAADGTGPSLAGAAMVAVFLLVLVANSVQSNARFGETLRLRLDLARRTRELDVAQARLLTEKAEHRATEDSLRHAQKMEAVGQLAGGIAHDFNNVLQAVSGGAALIRRRADDPAIERLAALIGDAARRGESVTRRLLAFTRQGELRAEVLDLGELLTGLREVLAATLHPAIRIDVDAAPGLPAVLADRGQLETVLVNLAVNARDAMPGGGTLTLSAAGEHVGAEHGEGRPAPGSYIRVVVQDTGCGMDAATLARACEPFFTTKAQGRGTGLGLPMARSFAEGSGGAFSIESAPGSGTRVSLWLPVAGCATGPEPAPLAAGNVERRTAGDAAVRRATVLLVDDEPVIRAVLTQELEQAGFDVVDAPDGATALTMLGRPGQINLLVTDLAMPGMDGVALIREARRSRPGLPAILLTGYAGEAVAMAAGNALDHAGTFALLRKPVAGAALADHVAALLHAAVPPADQARAQQQSGDGAPSQS